MGDAIVTPWGNWQFRWVAQVNDIMLDDGSMFIPPAGADQPAEIDRTNNRQLATEDPVVQEWGSMYFLNNQANLMLETLDAGEVAFSGDATVKTQDIRPSPTSGKDMPTPASDQCMSKA